MVNNHTTKQVETLLFGLDERDQLQLYFWCGSCQNSRQSPAEIMSTTKENNPKAEVVFYNFLVNHRVMRVETLLETVEEIDSKLKGINS